MPTGAVDSSDGALADAGGVVGDGGLGLGGRPGHLTDQQTALHAHLLLFLRGQRAQAQTDLAQLMRMDRATTMAIVNRLEARALLVRGKSPTDGRKQTLNLTDAGREILERAKLAIRDHETWLKSRFTDKEVSKLIELLTRIHE